MLQTIQQEFLQGVMAMQNGNYQQAKKHLEQSLRLNQSSSVKAGSDHDETCYQNLGEVKRMLKDYEGAISDYQSALARNPRIENAYMRIAECCFELETYDSIETAIETLNACTRYFPQNQGAFMNLGIACLKIGDTDNARTAFNNAKRLGNKDADRFIREYC